MINKCNILTNILNPTKRAKTKSHYSLILQGCMNTRSGRALFRNFRILLDSGSSLTIIMGKLMEKLKPKHSTETKWETQARKFTTSTKVNVEFYLPKFVATKIVTWKLHVAKSTSNGYDMILGRDLLTALLFYLKFSENIILGGSVSFKGFSVHMLDVSTYELNI